MARKEEYASRPGTVSGPVDREALEREYQSRETRTPRPQTNFSVPGPVSGGSAAPSYTAPPSAVQSSTPSSGNLPFAQSSTAPPAPIWQEQDADVAKQVAGVIDVNSPLMKRAATRGVQFASQRGLANSTMAGEAAQRAVLDVAVPIGSQNAAQINQRNVNSQGFQQEGVLQGARLRSGENIAGMETASREKVAGMEIASREKVAGMEIEARRQIAAADREAAMERLKTEVLSREQIAEADRIAQKERLGMELTQEEELFKQEIQSLEDRLNRELESQERRDQNRIDADLQVEAQRAINQVRDMYGAMVNTIMNNTDIPADTRNAYLEHAAAMRDQDLQMIEQMYGIEINWDTPGVSTPSPPPPPPPGAPNFNY